MLLVLLYCVPPTRRTPPPWAKTRAAVPGSVEGDRVANKRPIVGTQQPCDLGRIEHFQFPARIDMQCRRRRERELKHLMPDAWNIEVDRWAPRNDDQKFIGRIVQRHLGDVPIRGRVVIRIPSRSRPGGGHLGRRCCRESDSQKSATCKTRDNTTANTPASHDQLLGTCSMFWQRPPISHSYRRL